MHLVVGLGNPGRDYVGTRHNIGFEVIDSLAYRLGWMSNATDFDRVARVKFDGLTMDGLASLPGGGSEKLLLLKPTTYMNLSGRSVQGAMAFYGLSPSDVLIVLDDVALPCGRLRLRSSGSSGGHNGLKDIERALGTADYPRLRAETRSRGESRLWRGSVLDRKRNRDGDERFQRRGKGERIVGRRCLIVDS
jgi:PTH1 family peptidyl-tRNA hydrolase